MSIQDYQQAQHAARAVALADALRAFLSHCIEDDPEVVSLRVTATFNPGAAMSDIDFEFIGVTGMAIGGGSL